MEARGFKSVEDGAGPVEHSGQRWHTRQWALVGRAARAYRDIDETLQKGGSEGRNRDGNGLGDGDGNARSVGMDAANLQLVIESLGFDDVSHREREDLEARSSTISGGGAVHGRRGVLRRVMLRRPCRSVSMTAMEIAKCGMP